MKEERKNFGSKLGVIMAAAGSAVGLGNVWRFPTEVGRNGGAAFILVYLLCVLLIGAPLMLSEFVVGRSTHANPIKAYSKLAPGSWWRVVGVEGVVVAFLILSFYVIVSGWTLYYTVQSFAGALMESRDYKAFFSDFTGDAWMPVLYGIMLMLLVHVVIVRGVQNGIEKFSKVMMPLLLAIIMVLAACSFRLPGFGQGMAYLLKPDFSKITTDVLLSAMGQAFFSLSLAMGCLCAYASYFDSGTRLQRTVFSVSVIDTLVAVMSGFIIFPAVFSVQGLQPNEGAGLVFITLPSVFNMVFGGAPFLGYLFSGMFYMLLLLAALTSAMSLHEPVTAYLHESFGLTRHKAATLVSLSCMSLGVVCSLSCGIWSGYTIFGLTFFDFLDFLTAKIIMPVGGLLICIFVGWVLDRKLVRDEVTNGGKAHTCVFPIYMFLIRYVVPIAICVIFFNELLR